MPEHQRLPTTADTQIVDTPTERVIEVRCPDGPRKLFTKLRLGERPRYIQPGNLIEFPCHDCTKQLAKQRSTMDSHTPVKVFHRFNFLGELVSTHVEPSSTPTD